MTKRKNYISKVLKAFKEEMLPALSKNDEKVFSCLCRAQIDATKLPFEFELGKLFNALLIWCQDKDIGKPETSDWQKDFNEFANQLMNGWLVKELDSTSLKINVVKSSRQLIKCKYQLSNT